MKRAFLILTTIIVFSSCADTQNNIDPCLEGDKYKFFGGLWHGIVSPISLVGSMFYDDIDVYAKNNSGGWYDFGFLLGIGLLGGSSSSQTKRK